MKKISIIIVFIVAISILSGCSTTIEGDKALNNKEWIDDIEYLDKTLKSEHPDLFRYVSEKAWNKSINKLKLDINNLSDIDISLRIAQIISLINDAHTNMDILNILTPIEGKAISKKDVVEFPIDCEYFEDGLRVIACSSEYKEVLGYKLLSINNTEIGEVIQSISTLVSYDNTQSAIEQSKEFINIYEFLKFLEIIDTNEAEYMFENDNKEKIRLKVRALKNDDINYVSLNKKEPKINEKPEGESDFYWFNHFKEDNILYLKFNKCFSSTSKGITKEQKETYPDYYSFQSKLTDKINSIDFNKFIIDLRENKGGSRAIVYDMSAMLKNRTNLRGDDIVIITGKKTGSAAVELAWKIQSDLDAIVIGEETGGNVNLFGTDGYSITLPNSKLMIRYPSSIIVNYYGYSGGVKPNIVIKQTYENYIKGIDDCYEYIKSQNSLDI